MMGSQLVIYGGLAMIGFGVMLLLGVFRQLGAVTDSKDMRRLAYVFIGCGVLTVLTQSTPT